MGTSLNHTHSVSLLARNLVSIICAIIYHKTGTYTCTPISLQVSRIQINSLKNNFPTGYFKFEPPSGNIFEPHQYYILQKQYIIYVLNIILQKQYIITVWQPVAVLKVPKSGKQPTLVRISIAKQVRNGSKRRPGTRSQKAIVTVTENYSVFCRIRYLPKFGEHGTWPKFLKFQLVHEFRGFKEESSTSSLRQLY